MYNIEATSIAMTVSCLLLSVGFDAVLSQQSCSELKKKLNITSDGEYCLDLYHDGLVRIYCHNMIAPSGPQEFISLPAGDSENYAITSNNGGQRFAASVYFSKVAFNILSREIICDDYTFARIENTQGSNHHKITEPSYGKSYSCNLCEEPGQFKINLTGTPFQLSADTSVQQDSSICVESTSLAADRQYMAAVCGGEAPACGGCRPEGYNRGTPRIALTVNMSLLQGQKGCLTLATQNICMRRMDMDYQLFTAVHRSNSDSQAECAWRCAHTPGCYHFMYSKSIRYQGYNCYIHNPYSGQDMSDSITERTTKLQIYTVTSC